MTEMSKDKECRCPLCMDNIDPLYGGCDECYELSEIRKWNIYTPDKKPVNPHPLNTPHHAWLAAKRNEGKTMDQMIEEGYRANYKETHK